MRIGNFHPRGWNFNQGLGKPRPDRNSEPSGEISLSYMETYDGLLYSRNLELESYSSHY